MLVSSCPLDQKLGNGQLASCFLKSSSAGVQPGCWPLALACRGAVQCAGAGHGRVTCSQPAGLAKWSLGACVVVVGSKTLGIFPFLRRIFIVHGTYAGPKF